MAITTKIPDKTRVLVLEFKIEGLSTPEEAAKEFGVVFDRGAETPAQLKRRLEKGGGDPVLTVEERDSLKYHHYRGPNLIGTLMDRFLELNSVRRQERFYRDGKDIPKPAEGESMEGVTGSHVLQAVFTRGLVKEPSPEMLAGEDYLRAQLSKEVWGSMGIYAREDDDGTYSVLIHCTGRLKPDKRDKLPLAEKFAIGLGLEAIPSERALAEREKAERKASQSAGQNIWGGV